MASVDHVKMNSWWKFGECSTNRYYYPILYLIKYYVFLTVPGNLQLLGKQGTVKTIDWSRDK